MSLKTLISSLIESVFTSKKSYISAQAFPQEANRIDISKQTGGNYTAPCDGYFGIYVQDDFTFIDLYSENNGGRKTSFRVSNGNLSGSGSIPIRKGDMVNWNGNKEPNELWFIPSEGGQ